MVLLGRYIPHEAAHNVQAPQIVAPVDVLKNFINPGSAAAHNPRRKRFTRFLPCRCVGVKALLGVERVPGVWVVFHPTVVCGFLPGRVRE